MYLLPPEVVEAIAKNEPTEAGWSESVIKHAQWLHAGNILLLGEKESND